MYLYLILNYINSFNQLKYKIEVFELLAKMSNSRSDITTQFVQRVFEGSFNGVSSKLHFMFQLNFKGVACFMEVQRKFQGCLNGVSAVFQGCFKGVSRKFHGCFRVFQGRLKDVSREL